MFALALGRERERGEGGREGEGGRRERGGLFPASVLYIEKW